MIRNRASQDYGCVAGACLPACTPLHTSTLTLFCENDDNGDESFFDDNAATDSVRR